MKIKYFSTFTGIGGFELGIGKKGECVGYSEFDPSCDRQKCKGYHTAINETESKCDTCGKIKTQYPIEIYKKHFNHKNYGDITTINAKEVPDHDLFVGGFPCQAFSIAGKRGGFNDTRGTLFFDIARIIRKKQPRLLLLENVKGLLSHNKGRTFYTIITTLDELGYDCQWQVLNSKNHGVPQNRERVFIIGHLRGTPRPQVFPFGQVGEENTAPNKTAQAVNNASRGYEARKDGLGACLRAGEMGSKNIIQLNQPKHSNDRVYRADGISPTLNTMQGGKRQPFVVDPDLNSVVSCKHGKESKLDDGALEGKKELRQEKRCLLCLQEKEKDGHSSQERRLAQQQIGKPSRDMSQLPLSTTQPNKNLQAEKLSAKKEKVRILRKTQPEIQEVGQSVQGKKQSTLQGARIRRLTVLECERLQGFPDVEKRSIIEVCKNANGAEISLNIKNPDNVAQADVLIDCEENGVEILNHGKSLFFAKNVEKKNWSRLHIKTDDFVQMIVGINTIKERIIGHGGEGLHQSEPSLTHQKNGLKLGNLCGKEIMRVAENVKKGSATPKELLKFITLNHSDTENLEQKLLTLSSFVTHVITGFIPEKIQNQDTFTIEIRTRVGWTYGLSDTQRYKTLGNAVTVNVVRDIIKKLL